MLIRTIFLDRMQGLGSGYLGGLPGVYLEPHTLQCQPACGARSAYRRARPGTLGPGGALSDPRYGRPFRLKFGVIQGSYRGLYRAHVIRVI